MNIAIFAEDAAQLNFIRRLVERTLADEGVQGEIIERNAVGGVGRALSSLRTYVRDLAHGRDEYAPVLVVAIDGNCQRPPTKIRAIRAICERAGYAGSLVCAIPDPHIEIWYLADGRAVGEVAGSGRQEALPAYKCEPDTYKRLLEQSFVTADIYPALGGAEYGTEIADALDVEAAERSQVSLRSFRDDLRGAIRLNAHAQRMG